MLLGVNLYKRKKVEFFSSYPKLDSKNNLTNFESRCGATWRILCEVRNRKISFPSSVLRRKSFVQLHIKTKECVGMVVKLIRKRSVHGSEIAGIENKYRPRTKNHVAVCHATYVWGKD